MLLIAQRIKSKLFSGAFRDASRMSTHFSVYLSFSTAEWVSWPLSAMPPGPASTHLSSNFHFHFLPCIPTTTNIFFLAKEHLEFSLTGAID